MTVNIHLMQMKETHRKEQDGIVPMITLRPFWWSRAEALAYQFGWEPSHVVDDEYLSQYGTRCEDWIDGQHSGFCSEEDAISMAKALTSALEFVPEEDTTLKWKDADGRIANALVKEVPLTDLFSGPYPRELLKEIIQFYSQGLFCIQCF